MISEKVLYSLDDVMIQPAAVTTIRHRKDIKSVYDDGYLPIFTAPMPCVVNSNQYQNYINARINPIIPRTELLDTRIHFLEQTDMFVAFSLDEFTGLFLMNHYGIDKIGRPIKVLIDIACGNMEALHWAIQSAKNLYGDKMIIMSGNVANPESFRQLVNCGCDLIRCSVGSGSGCGTATYTGVYYPMASLIDECYNIKKEFNTYENKDIKIIADGGITRYRDAFKALALGADYVMVGSRLCQCEDSAGEIINKGETLTRMSNKRKLYFGMASEMGSQLLGKDTSAPEGMVKEYPILEPIADFANKFSSYLASTMSYCNAKNLDEFIGKQTLNVISQSAQKQFNQ